jgi:hypothetical protein
MRKLGLVVVAALVGSIVFSGCFVMRTLTFTKDTVDAGEKTTALISVAGDTADMMRGVGQEHPFFFLASEGGSSLANGGTFDTKGVFDGPVPLKKNNALAAAASDSCQATLPVGKRGTIDAQTAVTTENPFVATNERKFMDAKVPIRASEQGRGDAFGIFMGTWTDDGDGDPEDEGSTDDAYDCQPPYLSLIRIKGGAPAR